MVISGVNTVTYNGDGVTTAWPFTFPVTDDSEIRVQLNNTDGTAVIVEKDYYVDLVNSTVYYPGYAPGAEPPAEDQPPKVQTGQTITVYREIPMTQEADLGEKWPFEVIEKGLDKLTMIAQQIDSSTKRTMDNALASMFQLAGIVTDSDKLQHITDQYNAIDANAAAAAESEENAAASATAAANSATAASTSATNASNSASSASTTATQLMAYLEDKETLTAPAVDPTLTISGAAADAKATGDKINDVNSEIDALSSNTKRTVSLSDLTFVQNGYVNDNGNLIASGRTNRIVSMDASKITYVSFNTATALTSNLAFAVLKDSSNNIIQVLKSTTSGLNEFNITPQNGYTLYISFYNHDTTPNPYYSTIQIIDYGDIVSSYHLLTSTSQSLSELEKTQARTNIDACDNSVEAIVSNGVNTIELSSMTYVQNGYIDGSGNFVSPGSVSHKIVSMDASNIRYLQFKTDTAYSNSYSFGVIKDSSNNVIQVFKFDNTTNLRKFDITPQNGYTLYVSWFNYATIPNPNYSNFGIKDYESVIDAYHDEVEEILRDVVDEVKYRTCARKPYDFSGKKLYFFGDSITYGYIAASGGTPAHQATNQYPKLFSQYVGATYVNLGVSGSTLSVVTGYSSILTAIQSANLTNVDVVFVAGGVNDWQLGVDEATLRTGVENICDYLDLNFSGRVIFIAPINEAGRTTINPPTQTLQNARNVITQVALEHGYDVVQGWEFPFPTKNDTSSYISFMFQDKLHPTEAGYALYAQALLSALC